MYENQVTTTGHPKQVSSDEIPSILLLKGRTTIVRVLVILQCVKLLLLLYFAAVSALGKGNKWEEKARCLKMGHYG